MQWWRGSLWILYFFVSGFVFVPGVIPAQAGIQLSSTSLSVVKLDSRFHGNDGGRKATVRWALEGSSPLRQFMGATHMGLVNALATPYLRSTFEGSAMTATSSRFFDEIAKLMTNAAGAAQGVRKEVDTLVQAQVERVLNNVDVVKREEFEVVRAMAEKARVENEALEKRIVALEERLKPATN